MRVLYVSADKGGCLLYRCSLPGLELHNAGHTVMVTEEIEVANSGQIFACRSVEGRGGQMFTERAEIVFDVVVFQRFMREDAAEKVRRAREWGQVVINDVDDWFWGLPTSNVAFRNTHPKLHPDNNRDHYMRALQASSAVTVSTPYLADRISSFVDCPVHVLRNAVDPARYLEPERQHGDVVKIGWVGAVAYRSPGDLSELGSTLGGFMARHPQARFVHIGARTQADTVEITGRLGIQQREKVESRPFCYIEDLPAAMADIDVFLAPLEDTPFNRAKSAIKAQEASAAGAPFVASDMDEYRWFHDGRAGVLAADGKEWRDALERVFDPNERAKLARLGRERVEEVSIQKVWRKWEQVYEEAIST